MFYWSRQLLIMVVIILKLLNDFNLPLHFEGCLKENKYKWISVTFCLEFLSVNRFSAFVASHKMCEPMVVATPCLARVPLLGLPLVSLLTEQHQGMLRPKLWSSGAMCPLRRGYSPCSCVSHYNLDWYRDPGGGADINVFIWWVAIIGR